MPKFSLSNTRGPKDCINLIREAAYSHYILTSIIVLCAVMLVTSIPFGFSVLEQLIPSLICLLIVGCGLALLCKPSWSLQIRETDTPTTLRYPTAVFLALGFSVVSAAGSLVASAISGVTLFGESSLNNNNVEDLPFVLLIILFFLVCAATGFYEEGLFRVILPRALYRAFALNGANLHYCPLYASLFSAILFGALHLSFTITDTKTLSLLILIQVFLKFAQGFLFSLTMTLFLQRSGSFVAVALLHASYDAVVFLPWVLLSGVFPSAYITGAASDTWSLLVSAVALIIPATVCIRLLLIKEES